MKVRLGALGAFILALVLTCLCGCSSPAHRGDMVKVGTLRGQPHLYQPYFYANHAVGGVTFNLVEFDTAPDIITALTSGAIDFAIAGVPAVLAARANGRDVKIVASAADGGSAFVANASVRDLNSLTGKQVGYPQGSSQEILLRLTLANAGVDINKLTLVNLPFSDMASALQSGRISAFLSAETGPSIAIKNGAHILTSPYETPVGKVNIALSTTGKLIQQNPDLVQKVVDTHKAAVAYMASHKDEWRDDVTKTTGFDAQVISTAINNIWLRSDLSPDYQNQVAALAQQMYRIHILPNAPTPAEVFDTRFVHESGPGAQE